MAAAGLAAWMLGRRGERKAGFCNALCPILPVERLYGQAPLVAAGNPRCDGVKIEAENIQVGATYGPVTITAYDGKYVSFTSSEPIGLVIVKGGPNANLYDYNPAVTSDSNLHAPYNPNSGKYYGISHVNFCEVEKK